MQIHTYEQQETRLPKEPCANRREAVLRRFLLPAVCAFCNETNLNLTVALLSSQAQRKCREAGVSTLGADTSQQNKQTNKRHSTHRHACMNTRARALQGMGTHVICQPRGICHCLALSSGPLLAFCQIEMRTPWWWHGMWMVMKREVGGEQGMCNVWECMA